VMSFVHIEEKLGRWAGRGSIQSLLEQEGYFVPGGFQQIVTNYCGEAASADLQRYWDEIAREYVCSEGGADSDARKFKSTTGYRSEYLNDLMAKRVVRDSIFPVPPLNDDLHRFLIRQYADSNFAIGITEKLEADKAREVKMHNISRHGWSGEKKAVYGIAKSFFEARGFGSYKNRFVKESNSGLIFTCLVDAGGRAHCVSLPFHFYMTDGTETLMREITFEKIVPGFAYYFGFKSPENAVLGIDATAALFGIFSESFNK
jgi:hypothetical protein